MITTPWSVQQVVWRELHGNREVGFSLTEAIGTQPDGWDVSNVFTAEARIIQYLWDADLSVGPQVGQGLRLHVHQKDPSSLGYNLSVGVYARWSLPHSFIALDQRSFLNAMKNSPDEPMYIYPTFDLSISSGFHF